MFKYNTNCHLSSERGAGLILAHVVITYLVKGTVLARATHLAIWPEEVNSRSLRSQLQWLLITSSIMLCAYLLAMSIPIFDNLSGLIGSLLAPPICFNIPCAIFVSPSSPF